MADSVQNVRIRFTSDTAGLNAASKELSNLTKAEAEAVKGFKALNDAGVKANQNIQAEEKKTVASTKEVEKSTSGLSKSFNAIGASIVAAFSVGAILNFGKQVIDITSQFQKLEAVLTNTLGSQSAAQDALKLIKDFAATTNFSVLELTNGFVKLANAGFVPTKDELTKLADVANSTGKSFDQLVEAILDANTFQFERLKEFGIKANQEGNKINFTFKGVTTEVEKTSDSVQKYLIGLGELEGVSGSTAAISATLGGQISNLGDAYDSLLLTIGKDSSGGLSQSISILNSGINELTKAFQGQESVFTPLFNVVRGYFDLMTGLYESVINLASGFDKTATSGEVVYGVFKGIEVILKLVIVPLKLAIQGITTLIDGLNLLKNAATGNFSFGDINKLKSDANKFIEIITLSDGQRQKVIEDGAKKTEVIEKKSLDKRVELTQEQLDKKFKAQLDYLSKEEKLEIAKAKLADKSEADILRIQEEYNDRRIALFGKFGKTRTEDYKFLVLKTEELEKELTQFYTQEEENRRKARLELRDKQLSDIEAAGKAQISAQETAGNTLIEVQRNLYASGKINKEQFDAAIEDIDYKSKRRQIEIAIEADQDKLAVTKLSAEQIATIEKDLNDKKKELNDLDFAQFQENEERKVKAAKQRSETIKQIEQAAFDATTSIIGSLFQIGQNNRDAEFQDLEAQKKNELALAGDSKQKQDEINQRFAKKELELKRKSAQADKDQATFDAIINAAVAATKAFAQGGVAGFVTAALIAAATGVQIASIQSRPLPKFFEGSEFVELNGNKPGRDTIPAMINYGERIVPTEINKSLSGIPNSELPKMAEMWRKRMDYEGIQRDIISGRSGGSQDGVIKELKNVSKKLDKIKTAEINIDKNGIKTLIKTSNSEVESLNNYFRL